jgi:hypothetical protein
LTSNVNFDLYIKNLIYWILIYLNETNDACPGILSEELFRDFLIVQLYVHGVQTHLIELTNRVRLQFLEFLEDDEDDEDNDNESDDESDDESDNGSDDEDMAEMFSVAATALSRDVTAERIMMPRAIRSMMPRATRSIMPRATRITARPPPRVFRRPSTAGEGQSAVNIASALGYV